MGAYGSRQFREHLEALKSNDPGLYALSLEQVPLGDEGARLLSRALQGNRVLRRLCLGHCGISSIGLQSLASALCDGRSVPSRLRRLELSTSPAPFPLGNPIGDDGAVAIVHLILNCESLRHLSLGSCNLGDEGAGIIAQALAGNKSLRTLDLSYNSISDIGAEKLGGVLSRNDTLRGLSFWHNRVFHSGAEALANGIASNTTLKWLGLGCNHIGDEGVKALALALLSNAHDSSLVWLGLGGNEITDRGAEHFAVALKAQHMTNGHLPTADGEEGETASLTEQIRAGGLRPALELGVTPSHVSLAAAQSVQSVHSIQSSSLPPGEEELGEGAELSEDGVEGQFDGFHGDGVYCIPLESVGLGGNQITSAGAAALADGLKSNTRLVSLGLADNLIGDEGAGALAELVRQSDTLETIILSGNDIGNEGGSIMIAALAQNTSLKALYMAGNPLGDAVSERCLEVVGHHNHTLQLLDVHNTRMSTPAVSKLVEGMQEEGILRALGSQPVPVRSDGVRVSHDLPATGNMLEMQDWKLPSYHTVLLQKQGKRFTSTAPSQRLTTYEALARLPAPEETAQALVIKGAESEGGASHKRRESISHFFKRKFSRKKDSSMGSYDISHSLPTRKISKSPLRSGGHELHTLSENEEDELAIELEETSMMEGGRERGKEMNIEAAMTERGREMMAEPVFEETMWNSQLSSEEPFITSTLISSDHSHSLIGMQRHHITTPPTENYNFSSPPTLTDEFSLPAEETHISRPLSSLDNISSDLLPTENLTGPPILQSSAPQPPAKLTAPLQRPLAPQPQTAVTGPPQRSHPQTTPPQRPLAPRPSAKLTGPPQSSLPQTTPPQRPLAPQPSAKLTGPPQRSLQQTAPPQRPLAPQPSAKLTGPPQRSLQQTAPPQQPLAPQPSAGPPREMLNDRRGPHTVTNKRGQDEEEFDSVESSEPLSSLTKNRVRPPSNRRPPSRQQSPSPSPRRLQSSTPSSLDRSTVMRVGGITGISAESAPAGNNWPELDPVTFKQQWRSALQKRVGMLNMGSFLHTSYEALSKFKPHPPPDVSYAELPRNRPKNRRGSPLPPGHSRVKLQLVLEEVGSDYINASYVGVPGDAGGRLIVTQAPITNTIGDFWRMVWEQRAGSVVVMATEEEERWWPQGQGASQRHSLVIGRSWAEGCLSIKVVGMETKVDFDLYRLSLESIEEQESDTVLLYHFRDWPRHAVPNNGLRGITNMYQEVMRSNINQRPTIDTPVVVVSELGAGRAGCFSAVAMAHRIMTDPQLSFIDGWSYDQNILDMVVRGVRGCRGNLVENLRQYEFCHHLLETVLVGGVKGGGATPTPTAGKAEKKPSKWRLFHGKSSSDKSSKPSATVSAGDRGRGGGGEKEGKQVTFGKQTKQPKVKEKKSKKTTNKGGSKHSVTPEAVDSMDDDAWGADSVNLLW